MKYLGSRIGVALAILMVVGAGRLPAQDSLRPGAVYHPGPLDAWVTEAALGLRLMTLPRAIVEEEINKAPSIELQTMTGLPWQLSLRTGVVLQFVTNHFRFGAQWSFRLGNFSFGIGDDWAYWFGDIDYEGFDNHANGWINYPGASVGYDFGDVRMTARGEGIFIITQRTYAGENEVSFYKGVLSGGALTLVMEQPLTRTAHVQLGVRLSWTNFHYQTWFAFSTFDRRLLFSELLFGVLL
jgi:hypothetical protein